MASYGFLTGLALLEGVCVTKDRTRFNDSFSMQTSQKVKFIFLCWVMGTIK